MEQIQMNVDWVADAQRVAHNGPAVEGVNVGGVSPSGSSPST